MVEMTFWNADDLDPDDEINQHIWATSRAEMALVLAEHPDSPAGLLQADLDLPWVPDLAGSRWRKQGSVFVIGSAYSPFLSGHAGRPKAMQLANYDPTVEVIEFQRRFIDAVVEGDANYYGPLATLLEPAVEDASQVVLLDLCRGCLIDRDTGKGGDDAMAADLELFMALAEANWGWTRDRLETSEAEAIVVRGFRAEHVLLRLLHADGFTMRIRGRDGHFVPPNKPITHYATDMRLGSWLDRQTWWEIEHREWGRRWKLLPVYHPAVSLDSRWDPGYVRTRGLLASMMGRPVPDVREVEGVQNLHASRQDRVAVEKATWAWVLAASVPPAGSWHRTQRPRWAWGE